MKATRNLGIWMDHASANLIEYKRAKDGQTITSDFTHTKKVEAMHKGENRMHQKEQQLNEAYYKEIADEILNYDHVLLFGPTDAKSELQNYLGRDLHFKDIQIDVEAADKMTENEQFARVTKYFENR